MTWQKCTWATTFPETLRLGPPNTTTLQSALARCRWEQSQHQTKPVIRARAARKRMSNIKVEAHLIPEHPRPRRVVGRVALVGDAAGCYQSSGEGIYFAEICADVCRADLRGFNGRNPFLLKPTST